MLEQQVRSNELDAIEKNKLEQRCVTFEELVENLQQKVKYLDERNEEANQMAESNLVKFNQAKQELKQVYSAINVFKITINACPSVLNTSMSLVSY